MSLLQRKMDLKGRCYSDYPMMRRSIALALMMLFGWTLVAPLLAADAGANLPACCRKNGKHHCIMNVMGQPGAKQSGPTTVAAKCPFCPLNACTAHSPTYKPVAAQAFPTRTIFHPARAPLTENSSQSSFLRGHPKRGPPTPLV
jgi:hypothetical protein